MGRYAWYCGNSGFALHPVRRRRPNSFGFFDMYGNVAEWVLDSATWRHPMTRRVLVTTNTYQDEISDPASTEGEKRIFRSGGGNQSARQQRATNRSMFDPDVRRNFIGFRIVKMVR